MSNNQSAGVWVKASERLPEKMGYYFTFGHHDRSYPQVTFWYANKKEWSSTTFEWLDESAANNGIGDEKDKEIEEEKEPFWRGQDYIQSGELPKIEQLFEDNGLRLELTCGACPEQYDVYKKVGYLRLRHGEFRVDFPDCGDETIYEAQPKGDGIFEGGERIKYMTEAMGAILKKLYIVWQPPQH